MREKLIQYVDLLFAGTSVYDEVRQEILQNTLDRYDDLVAEGKQPEAAYQLAIRGIGDIGEILRSEKPPTLADKAAAARTPEDRRKKLIQGLAIGLYILCPVPLFILQNEIGLCLLLVIVAFATGLLIWIGDDKEEKKKQRGHQESELEQGIGKLLGTVTLIVYLAVSFWTHAWYITWIIFPLSGAVRGLIKAILDLKEAVNHEN